MSITIEELARALHEAGRASWDAEKKGFYDSLQSEHDGWHSDFPEWNMIGQSARHKRRAQAAHLLERVALPKSALSAGMWVIHEDTETFGDMSTTKRTYLSLRGFDRTKLPDGIIRLSQMLDDMAQATRLEPDAD